MSLLSRAIGVACALAVLAVAAPPASAQSGVETKAEREERARRLFQEGQAHAQEGRYEAAVEKWLEAYEAQPVSLFLFNIAQAYRQLGACSSALYFYQRYLADDLESQYADVAEEHAKQLASECEPKSPWTEGGDGGGGESPDAEEKDPASGDEDEEAKGDDPEPAPEPAPQQPTQPISPPMFTAFAEAGPAFVSLGALSATTLTTIRAGMAYPVPLGPVEVQAGAATTFTPVPWTRSGESGTALLTGVMANAAARYPVLPKLFARGELGIGALIFSGVGHEDSIFIEDGLNATGALGMFHVRAQLGAEYELTRNIAVSLSPVAISFSPAHAGLDSEIGNLTRFEVLGGVSVRL